MEVGRKCVCLSKRQGKNMLHLYFFLPLGVLEGMEHSKVHFLSNLKTLKIAFIFSFQYLKCTLRLTCYARKAESLDKVRPDRTDWTWSCSTHDWSRNEHSIYHSNNLGIYPIICLSFRFGPILEQREYCYWMLPEVHHGMKSRAGAGMKGRLRSFLWAWNSEEFTLF